MQESYCSNVQKEIINKMLIMKRFIFVLIICVNAIVTLGQDKPAYKIFSKEGKPVDYAKMIKELSKSEIILFGELHDNSIDHWLELQVTKDIYAINNNLTIGMEMFESDNQLVLDEYLNGTIEEKHLMSEAKVWDNYKNDYKPLIEFAKEKKIKAIASNVPRRYANLVFRKGLEALTALPEDGKKCIAPLPIEVDLDLPGYKNMMAMASHGQGMNGENMAKSQAVKDATMAYFILKNRNGIFIHYNGSSHSQNFEGISYYLKKGDSKVKIATIHTVEQDSIDKLET